MDSHEKGPILVIGAGLAGLTAAWKLQNAGVEVIVLEASERVGGRAFTSTSNWHAGQYGDFGGEIIDGSYHALTTVAEELGVQLTQPYTYADPHPEDVSTIEAYLRVGRFIIDGRQLTSAEIDRTATVIRTAVLAHAPQAHELVEQWIRRAGLESQAAGVIRAVSRMLTQLDPWDCDVHYIFTAGASDFRRVLGGTQRLAEALAADLDVRLNSIVERVVRGSGIEIELADGTVLHGSRAICAVGPFAMPGIGFDPPLPPAKVEAAQSLLPAMGGKVLVQYAEGDLVRKACRNVVYSDGPVNAVWVGDTANESGPAVVAGFVCGVERALLTDTEQAVTAVEDLVLKATGATELTRMHAEIKNWWADPFAMSVTVLALETARTEITSVLAMPERRVHFAGDYTDAGLNATLEGAVRSGLRAASEVLRMVPPLSINQVNEGLVRQ